jgi:hypothetical protein
VTRKEQWTRKLARAVSDRVATILEAQGLQARAQSPARGAHAQPSLLPEATQVPARAAVAPPAARAGGVN